MFSLQNKMNKLQINRVNKSNKSPAPMRLIFKNRNNYKQKYQQHPPQSESKLSLTQSRSSIAPFQDRNLLPIDARPPNRFRTQYTDKFKGASTHIHKTDSLRSLQDSSIHHDLSARRPNQLSYKQIQPRTNTLDLSNQGKTHYELQNEVKQNSEEKQPYLKLENIQANLQGSLEKRLKTCLNFKRASDWDEDQTTVEFIAAVKDIRNQENNGVAGDPVCSDKKIGLIERMMAKNTVEGQILKKYYFSKITKHPLRKAKTTSLHKIEAISYNPEAPSLNPKASFIKTSANRDSFKKPDPTAYNTYHHHRGLFDADKLRQPLPRSSYNRQFLNYKSIGARIPCTRPQQSQIMKTSTSEKKMQSSYRQDFRSKSVQKTNIKDLDACKDKIRNLPINFGKKQREEIFSKLNRYIQQKRQQNIVERFPESAFIKSALLSESRRQYQSVKQGRPAKIKHENLNRLKFAYKNMLHV